MKNPTEDIRQTDQAPVKINPEYFLLINDIAKRFSAMLTADTPEKDASNGYRRMFRILCKQDGITQVELAKASKLSSPSVSAALNKMETDGLVKRVPDKKDRRKVFVYITDEGREHQQHLLSRCLELERIMMKDISDEERDQFAATLKKMLKNMLEEDVV